MISSPERFPRHRLATLLVFPLSLFWIACSDGGVGSRSAAEAEMASAPAAPPSEATAGGASIGYTGSAGADRQVREGFQPGALPADTAGGAPPQPSGSTPANLMIIRTGQATVEVDSLEAGIAQVRQLAQRLGGFVANTAVQAGEDDDGGRSATLELKIPAERFDQAVEGLRPVGRVESVNVTAQDVGEEYADVNARVTNARRLEARLLELLATRTGNLEQVLAVERELARVREEIERYEGRLRYLRTRVATSTLTVELHEPYPIASDYPGQNPILRAFRQAWRNFVSFLAVLIASLGLLVPLGLIAAAVVWLLLKLVRRFGGGARTDPPPPAGPPPPGPPSSGP
jgi:hypothetical protein